MKANKDPKIEIKEIDQNYYHVEFTRIVRDETGKHPEHQKHIQIYDRKEYDHTFGKGGFVEKHGLGPMNYDEVRIVHDPRLTEQLEQERNDAEAKRIQDAAKKKKAADAKANPPK